MAFSPPRRARGALSALVGRDAQRDVFPREDDRKVLRAFLHGVEMNDTASDNSMDTQLSSTRKGDWTFLYVSWQTARYAARIVDDGLWLNPDTTLEAPGRITFNTLCALVRMVGTEIDELHSANGLLMFDDGRWIRHDPAPDRVVFDNAGKADAMHLLGPLGLQVWRAANPLT